MSYWIELEVKRLSDEWKAVPGNTATNPEETPSGRKVIQLKDASGNLRKEILFDNEDIAEIPYEVGDAENNG